VPCGRSTTRILGGGKGRLAQWWYDSPGGGGKRKQERGGKAGEKKVPVIERCAVVPTGIGRTRGGIRGGRNPGRWWQEALSKRGVVTCSERTVLSGGDRGGSANRHQSKNPAGDAARALMWVLLAARLQATHNVKGDRWSLAATHARRTHRVRGGGKVSWAKERGGNVHWARMEHRHHPNAVRARWGSGARCLAAAWSPNRRHPGRRPHPPRRPTGRQSRWPEAGRPEPAVCRSRRGVG
jgi:hypothetical protein